MVVLFYWPLLNVLNLGFKPDVVGSAPNEIELWSVLWFTTWQALLSTLICLVLGIPGAYILYRKSFRGANVIKALITVTFMLPSLVVAIAISEVAALMGGLNPIVAIILANVFANYAVVVRNIGSQWQSLDVATEEEAEVAGAGRFATALKISLPQLRSSVRSSSAIIMLYCACSYGIVLSLGGGQVNTLETAISVSVLERLDFAHGALLALLQILFCVVAFTMSRWGGTNPLSFEPSYGRSPRVDKRDWQALSFTVITVLGLILLPLVLVLGKAFISATGSFTLDNFALLNTRGARDLLNITFLEAGLNSFRNLFVATLIALVVGMIVSSLLAEHSRKRHRRKTDFVGITLDTAFLLPMGVSSVVIAVGYLVTLTGPLSWLRSSWLLVPLVQALFAIPMVIRVLYPSLLAVEAVTREQAMTDGAKGLQLFWHIDLALIRPVLKTAIAFSALVSLGEFGVANLLAYGDQATIPVLMYQLIARPGAQNYSMALAVACILTLLTVIVVFLVGREQPKTSQRKRSAP